MPESLREILERNDQERDRMHIKALHIATTALGKAKRTLGEVVDARRAHRMAWTKHLTESVKLWERQLAEFRSQQAIYQEQAATATEEISKAKKTIHNLNAGKGDVAISDDEQVEPETTADQEEEQLRQQLSTHYKAFASSLGADVAKPQPELLDSDSGLEEEDQTHKEGQDKGTKRPCVATRT